MDIDHWERIGCPEQQEERRPVDAAYIIPYFYANFEYSEVSFND